MQQKIIIERIDPHVPLPSQGHPGDASYDMYAAETVTLAPGERAQVKTGIKIQLPKGFGLLIWDRSSLSHKHGLKTLGGVIDEGYRGEIRIGIANISDVSYTINQYDRVAQCMLKKVEDTVFVEGEVAQDTTRGEGAFGSTGK